MTKRKYIYISLGATFLTVPLLGSVLAYSCTSDENSANDDKKDLSFNIDNFYVNIEKYINQNITRENFITDNPTLKNKINELLNNTFNGATIGDSYNVVANEPNDGQIEFIINLPSGKKWNAIDVINNTNNTVFDNTNGKITLKKLVFKTENNDDFKIIKVNLEDLYKELSTYSTNVFAADWDNSNNEVMNKVESILKKYFDPAIKTDLIDLESIKGNLKAPNLTFHYLYNDIQNKVVFSYKTTDKITVKNNLVMINGLIFKADTSVAVDANNFYSSINKITPLYSSEFISKTDNNNILLNKLKTIFDQNCEQVPNKPKVSVKAITYNSNHKGLLFDFDIDSSLNFLLKNDNPNVELVGYHKILVKNLKFWNSESLNISQPTPEQNNFLTTQDYNSNGTYASRILKTIPRNLQKRYYQTDLWNKYHNSIGFIYPGWNRNYKDKNNSIFGKYSNKINALQLVYDETVPGSTNIKYNDPTWIEKQIENNTLFCHPAATNFFEADVNAIPNAVEKEFVISTGIIGSEPLGLFVPAGEIVTITFDEQTFDLMKKNNYQGISFVINDNLWDSKKIGNKCQISNRYPFVKSEFNVGVNSTKNNNLVNIDPKTKSIKIGTPFGGGLSLNIHDSLSDNPIIHYSQPIKFKVAGAIPCLFYQDGVTTEKDWDHQVNQALKGELGPVIQATSGFFSLQITSSYKNKYGNTDLSYFVYPKKTFKKWNDLFYLSNYCASNGEKGISKKLNMRFCDDAWTKTDNIDNEMNIYCPISWGVESFFTPLNQTNTFNFNHWDLFHEINHFFEQNTSLFRKQTNGQANIMTLFDYSVIGDIGRFRNEINYSGETNFVDNKYNNWTRLANEFTNIDYLNYKNDNNIFNKKPANKDIVDESSIYQLIISTIGSKNYADYVRKDVIDGPNTDPNWTGLKEIQELSDYTKLNFYPAMAHYGKYWWCDSWPTSIDTATNDEKVIINELDSKYPTFDFVGNLYACGNYLYDNVKKDYIYTGDTLPAFEIVPNQPKVFDLAKFINSPNKDFKWSDLKFSDLKFKSKTLKGGSLLFDNNTKQLTYTPPALKTIDSLDNEPDEFDITIVPDTWTNKPNNYVPGYKFKIKVRQAYDAGSFEIFKTGSTYPWTSKNDLLELTHNYDKENEFLGVFGSQETTLFNTKVFPVINRKAVSARIKFKFIAPEDGDYNFYANWDDALRVYVNGVQKAQFTSYNDKTPKLIFYQPLKLTKGEILDLEFDIVNTDQEGDFKLNGLKNNKPFDLYENIICSEKYAGNNLTQEQQSSLKYQSREINYQEYNSSISMSFNETTKSTNDINIIDTDKYSLILKNNEVHNGTKVNNTNNFDNSFFELWNTEQGGNQAISTFDINFNEPTDVGTLFFGFGLNNDFNVHTSHIKVTGFDEQGTKKSLYDKSPCLNRNGDQAYVPFNEIFHATKITVDIYNNAITNTKENSLVWKWLRVSSLVYKGDYNQSNIFGFVNPLIEKTKGWVLESNDPNVNISSFNNAYITVNSKDEETIKFTLNNATGFKIIGQQNCSNSSFDVSINGLLDKTVNVNNYLQNNAVLYEYNTKSSELTKINVEITVKNAKALFLNYIQTYGTGVYLSKPSNSDK